MINFLRNLFIRDWILVEANSSVWNLTHGVNGGIEQHFCFYKVEYSPKRNCYRLKTSGYRAKDHSMYADMLRRVAYLNAGQPIEEAIKNVENEGDRIVITQFALSYQADKVFSYVTKDEKLVKAITNVKVKLEKQSVEIFEQRDNIIATDKGYYGAFWESQLSTSNKPNNEEQ